MASLENMNSLLSEADFEVDLTRIRIKASIKGKRIDWGSF